MANFFKNDTEHGLLESNQVFFSDGTEPLILVHKDEYTLPIDGWYYFESEEEARVYFGLPTKEEEQEALFLKFNPPKTM